MRVLREWLYNFVNLKRSFFSLCQIIKIPKNGVTMFFSPDNNNTHPHTPRHSQNTSTDRSPSLKMLNYIFKLQQLDIICLLKRAGSSWVSIYTQTHTHTHPYIFTHTNIACQLPRHWHDWDLQQVNIWDFFAFSLSQTTSDLLVLFGHIILRIIATLQQIFTYTASTLAIYKNKRQLIQQHSMATSLFMNCMITERRLNWSGPRRSNR